MLRPIAAALFVLVLGAAVACGSDKPSSKPAATSEPTSAASAPTAKPAATATSAEAEQGSDAAVGNIFSTVLGGALSGGGGAPGSTAAKDPTLTRFLPADSDLPAGFTKFGEFTFRAPDGISETGGMDMAALMAVNGGLMSGDLSNGSMLMSMVMKPDDLTALGDILGNFGDLDDETLKKSIEDAGGSFQGIEIKDVHTLDASGLGEGAAGISMTMDLGDFASQFGGGQSLPGVSVMTMRMYMFGRGDYIGAVIRIGFSEELSGDVDELGLAKVIDAKLQAG